jgi:hypothetical protein
MRDAVIMGAVVLAVALGFYVVAVSLRASREMREPATWGELMFAWAMVLCMPLGEKFIRAACERAAAVEHQLSRLRMQMELTKFEAFALTLLLAIAAALILPGCSTPEDRGLRDFWDNLTKQAN